MIVALADQKAVAAWALASVDVTFTAAERKNVLTVPVAALLALREGGYGVEVVEGRRRTYVPVKTGLFADGRVEVTGAGIKAGHHGGDARSDRADRRHQGLPGRRDALGGCQPAGRPRRAGRDRRAVRLRQVDDAERARHARPADRRARSGSTGTTWRGCPTPAVGVAGQPDRVRVPAVPPRRRGTARWTTSPTGCSTPGCGSAERRQRAAAALERVGLGHRWTTSRTSCPAVSGSGWRSPGRSWASPPLLLADEPTGASTPRRAPG